MEIINYNTEYSGITKEILDPITNTIENKLHPYLATLLTDRTILVGHSLENDLRAMKLIHHKVIDSSVLYMRKNGSKLKLKNLADKILNVIIHKFSVKFKMENMILWRTVLPLSTSLEPESKAAIS